MNAIYKYALPGPLTALDLPVGARALTVQVQFEIMVLWALIDPYETRTAKRHFAALNTGDSFEIPGTLHYIGTTTAGAVVWHVFEVLP